MDPSLRWDDGVQVRPAAISDSPVGITENPEIDSSTPQYTMTSDGLSKDRKTH